MPAAAISIAPIEQAFWWWLDQLRQCLPTSSHQNYRTPQYIVDRDGELFSVGESGHYTQLPTPNAFKTGDLVFLLPPSSVLLRRHQFPAQARGRLGDILSLGTMTDIPFPSDQVVCDYRIAGENDHGEIDVEVAYAKRDTIKRAIDLIGDDLALTLSGVDVETGSAGAGFNLLPHDLRRPSPPLLSRPNKVLIVLTVALAISVVANSIYKDASSTAYLRSEIEALRSETDETLELRALLRTKRDYLNDIKNIRDNDPARIAILDELAAVLPDGTWLNSLRIDRDGATLTGRSRTATRLISLLEASPVFKGARFAAPITTDSEIGTDTFSITVALAGAGDQS